MANIIFYTGFSICVNISLQYTLCALHVHACWLSLYIITKLIMQDIFCEPETKLFVLISDHIYKHI